jgi:RimJ/RimL family protein N-acetyltransferase
VTGDTQTVKPANIRLKTTLADGTQVLIRPLRPGDRAELRRGFGLLSLASRRFRFISPIRRLTEPQLEQLTVVDQVNHVALGVRDVGRRGGPGIAVARFVRLQRAVAEAASARPAAARGPEVAEFAVTVIDEYQGRGLGTLLVRLLLRAARSVGVDILRGYVLEDNTAMWRVLQHFVTEIRRDAGNLLQVDLPVGRNPEAGPAGEPSAAVDGARNGLDSNGRPS